MTTKDEIKMEFLKLYTEQGYDKINIKELCARIPIARTTFYTYYSNVDEVKSEIEDEVIAQLVKTSGDNVDKDIEAYVKASFDYILENKQIFYPFLVSPGNVRFQQKWKEAFAEHFKHLFTTKKDERLAFEVAASAVIGAYTYFLEHPSGVDMEEFYKYAALIVTLLKNLKYE